ncbi:MAG: uroporphyrinogen decarboxylase family protein [Monoglobales bacterium]
MSGKENVTAGIQKLYDFYEMKKGAPIYQEEFGFYSLERWIEEGYIKENEDLNKLFMYDEQAKVCLAQLGWCDAAFCPEFEEEVLEDRGDHELVRDYAGRHVLFFKGRRSGFMPEYIDNPVKDWKTWERDVKWRLDPNAPGRFSGLENRMDEMKKSAEKGMVICQNLVGGYMYLRSLIGPEKIMYMVYDEPELIHDCMKTWFELADAVIAKHQEHITIDELFMAEDICYNNGPLISPNMIREFLFPYYEQLIANVKKRQLDKERRLHIQIDTDGDCRPVIPVYKEIGMNYMSPFEVASGCDVVEIRKQYPELLIRGGIDKRILAEGKDAIDRELERVIPFMREQGGYIPTCDHGVPAEVDFENYMHYRKRMIELCS